MVVTLNSLEINIAIFICCVPALNTLFRRIREKTKRSASPHNNTPDFGKTPEPNGPLDGVASQSDNTSNRQHSSHEDPNLDISGSIGDEGENRNGSSQELPQDAEKMGQ
jgi:hypothetical protein